MSQLDLLDELGILRVTDKSSLEHDYLTKYERLFAPFRDEPITLLEIGVFDGGSLLLWEDYFPRGKIVGLDIRPDCKKHEGGRRIVEIASQADAKAMTAIGEKYKPQIIIDDGSHQADHILTSFEALYPSVRQAGLYIVEELGMHAGSAATHHRGSAVISPQQYFLRLANLVACHAEEVAFDQRTVWATEAVEFFYCAVSVRKKKALTPDYIATRRALVEKSTSPHTWGWFSGCLIRSGLPEEAVECAKKAILMAPEELVHYIELSRALEHAGQLKEAISVAEQTLQRGPGHPTVLESISRLSGKLEALGGKVNLSTP
jgi:hypothetical protein